MESIIDSHWIWPLVLHYLRLHDLYSARRTDKHIDAAAHRVSPAVLEELKTLAVLDAIGISPETQHEVLKAQRYCGDV